MGTTRNRDRYIQGSGIKGYAFDTGFRRESLGREMFLVACVTQGACFEATEEEITDANDSEDIGCPICTDHDNEVFHELFRDPVEVMELSLLDPSGNGACYVVEFSKLIASDHRFAEEKMEPAALKVAAKA
jgi:hypothetical protein